MRPIPQTRSISTSVTFTSAILQKDFDLREAPKTITDVKKKVTSVFKGRGSPPLNSQSNTMSVDAEQRMQNIVRVQDRLLKKGGKMISSGTDEFQIASGFA